MSVFLILYLLEFYLHLYFLCGCLHVLTENLANHSSVNFDLPSYRQSNSVEHIGIWQCTWQFLFRPMHKRDYLVNEHSDDYTHTHFHSH